MLTDFTSIMQVMEKFTDEQSCIDYLEQRRWPEGAVSPFDPESKVYKYGNKYKCKNTNKYFNVKTGTLFEGTKLPLRTWMIAIYIVITEKKGISSINLASKLGVTQTTSWKMLYKIRYCMKIENEEPLQGVVEGDETFSGGKNKNRHMNKRVKYSEGRAYQDKTPVLGLMQRATEYSPKRMRLIVLPSTTKEYIHPALIENVKLGTTLYTDEWPAYKGLSEIYDHHHIDHSKYQYTDGNIHTNTIEGSWSILKRSIMGSWHHVSRKHLQVYCYEIEFRYNTIELTVGAKLDKFCRNTEKRITHKMIAA